MTGWLSDDRVTLATPPNRAPSVVRRVACLTDEDPAREKRTSAPTLRNVRFVSAEVHTAPRAAGSKPPA